jgi:membrane protease subunit HflC
MNSRILIGVIVVVVAVFVALNAVFVLEMTEQAIVTQLGEFKRTELEPGMHLKIPFLQQTHRFDKRVLASDATPAEYLTLDKKRLVVDSYTRWRIVDPLTFFMSVRNEAAARNRLDGMVNSELRTHIASRNFHDIIGGDRESIMEDVAEKAGEIVRPYGIQLIDVRIKRADLPREVQSSVFARMGAERQRIAKKYRAEGEEQALVIRANADKEATIIMAEAHKTEQELMGEGDASAIQVYAAAYQKDPEFYYFQRSLDAYARILEKKTTLLLDSRSPLFRYLETPTAR